MNLERYNFTQRTLDPIKYHIDFYKALAQLFYAVSMSDGQMTREEKLTIIQWVEKYWTVTIQERNSQDIIYTTLKEHIANKVQATNAFTAFKDYYNTHKDTFDKRLEVQIMGACTDIAEAFGKKNKSELILLSTLALLFKS